MPIVLFGIHLVDLYTKKALRKSTTLSFPSQKTTMAESASDITIGPPSFHISPYLEPEVEEKVPVVQETVWKANAALTAAFEF